MNAYLMFDAPEGFMGQTIEADRVQNTVAFTSELKRLQAAGDMARKGFAVLLEINGKTTEIFPATPNLF